jgi:hypothetical protein
MLNYNDNRMKKRSLLLVFVFASKAILAQDFSVPKNYKFEKVQDYAVYEQDIIACIDWLYTIPLDQHEAKRMEANAFLMKWLIGCPHVTIEIHPEIVTFMKSSPELLMIFMGGWARHSLISADGKSKVDGNIAGLEAVMDFYSRNKSAIGRDVNVEKYLKMKKKGALRKHVEKYAQST